MGDYDADLDELRHHWGSAYIIEHPGPDTWVAQRRDSRQTLAAQSPESLLEKIRADYSARPVGRQAPPSEPEPPRPGPMPPGGRGPRAG